MKRAKEITPAKLTIRQIHMMCAAARHGSVAVEVCVGRGPQGGRISFGHRERQAASTLLKKGLLRHAGYQSHVESSHGYGVTSYISRWELTPEGRAVVES